MLQLAEISTMRIDMMNDCLLLLLIVDLGDNAKLLGQVRGQMV